MPSTKTPVMLFDPSTKGEPGNRYTPAWEGTPEHVAFLDWCRAEGIVPENAKRVEIYEDHGRYTALATMYDLDESGHKRLTDDGEDFATGVETVRLSSLPPLT